MILKLFIRQDFCFEAQPVQTAAHLSDHLTFGDVIIMMLIMFGWIYLPMTVIFAYCMSAKYVDVTVTSHR